MQVRQLSRPRPADISADVVTRIYKICPTKTWRAAEQAGVFRGYGVDVEDGFIHFSTDAQVRETAARHFANEPDLVLIEVDADEMGPDLLWEPSRGGDLFPHLYGELAIGKARTVSPLPLGPNGAHQFPQGVGDTA